MASLPSTGATLHLGFRAVWEARQAAISGRSTFLRRTNRQRRLRAFVACWNAFYEELPTRSDRLREKLSSENREQHAAVPTDRTPGSNIRRSSGKSYGTRRRRADQGRI